MSKSSLLKALTLGLLLAGIGLARAEDTPAPAASTATGAAQTTPETVAPDMPAAQADRTDAWNDVMQLGTITAQGDREDNARRIIAGLKVIKSALKAKLTNNPADDKVVVCRINYATGSHVVAHLMCATNGTLRAARDQQDISWQNASGVPDGGATQMLQHLNDTASKGSYFSTKINATELQKLLLEIQCEGCSNSGLVVGNN